MDLNLLYLNDEAKKVIVPALEAMGVPFLLLILSNDVGSRARSFITGIGIRLRLSAEVMSVVLVFIFSSRWFNSRFYGLALYLCFYDAVFLRLLSRVCPVILESRLYARLLV